jgi:uncharacterized OB-fold protein
LVAALEEAKPNDRILLANYGDGADAYLLRVTEAIEGIRDRRGIRRHLKSKIMLESYGKYLRFRNLIPEQPSLDYELRTSLPLMWRDRKRNYRFYGYKCKSCGRIQYPPQRVCMWCQAKDDFEEVRLSDRKGTLFTFSMDERAPVVNLPSVLAVVDLDDDGRFYSQMTDREAEKIEIGMRMELTFRRFPDALGVHNYFWKTRPIRE